MILFFPFAYFANSLDFFFIIFTGNNYPFDFSILAAISYILLAIGFLFTVILFTNLFELRNKKVIIILTFFFAIIDAIVISIYTEENILLVYPSNPGEYSIDYNIISGSPLTYFSLIIMIGGGLLGIIGPIIKAVNSTGIIRKKFFYIAIATSCIDIGYAVEGFTDFEFVYMYLFRFTVIFWIIFNYMGLREEPEKKVKTEKETKVEGGLFRISKKLTGYTEEEISLYRDQMICLVCKGHSAGFEIYICPDCRAFYCKKCATALINLENACWAWCDV